MLRTTLWFIAWCCCLGFVSVHVRYSDGLEIKLLSHEQRKAKKEDE